MHAARGSRSLRGSGDVFCGKDKHAELLSQCVLFIMIEVGSGLLRRVFSICRMTGFQHYQWQYCSFITIQKQVHLRDFPYLLSLFIKNAFFFSLIVQLQ